MWPWHMWPGGSFGNAMIIGGIILLGFLLLIVLIFILIRAFSNPDGASRDTKTQSNPTASALDILKERYARGEIDRETYQEMRRDLET